MSMAIVSKHLRDRWVGPLVVVVSLSALLWMGLVVYGDIDLALYSNLPESMRSLMGIPADADAGVMSFNVMFGTIGSLALAGIALSMGAAAIAGEERSGTFGLLLANPASRTGVLLSKAASMLLLVAAVGVLLWAAGRLVPALVDTEVGEAQVGAMALHLAVNAVFYGSLALAIGAWTGSRSLASGVTVGVMLAGFVGTGLLPAIEGSGRLVEALPWYYFDGSQPLLNGIHWGHLAVLAGSSVVFLAVGVVGLNRRDLRGAGADGAGLVERLREHPLTRRVADRLAGSVRASRIWVKTITEHQGLVLITAGVMFSMMGLLMGPMYTLIDQDLATLTESLPEVFLSAFGGGDMSTPEGFLQTETFGLMAPIATILVGVAVGARALAGEEARRTMGLLLANPIGRSRVVVEKTAAMVLAVMIVGVAIFAGVSGGVALAGLDVSIANIAATSLLVALLGLVFGAMALALSAGTGRVGVAVYGTVAAAVVFYVANAFLPLSDRLADWARISLFYYYLGSDPLSSGMHWGHAGLLTGLAVALVLLAVGLFERRDLRQRG